ncbi:hypothetical protein DVR12_19405 [Chitinophaga silvatica]|uniref:Uncharacterized protein n=1 Tax=Chitinophaga silvatica TaxID=2282649 RepID=A0A3E1Y6Z3_9BACT|nr:hypothetical protein [Chitinophaga silvatica]RFS20726.1 hypothetical protein DVR12_19405 [Chitinophaga silvatica]
MKKAKFALASAFVLAIAGGAIAYKGSVTFNIYIPALFNPTVCTQFLGSGYITGGTYFWTYNTRPDYCGLRNFLHKVE